MKANLIITKSDNTPMAIVNAEVTSVMNYTATLDVQFISKTDLNELVKLEAGISFFEKSTHLSIPRRIIKSIEFV